MQESTLETGRRGDWWWLVDRGETSRLNTLVEECPNLFVNRFVAVTASDSSPFRPNKSELYQGWTWNQGEAALSPKLDHGRLF